MSLATSPVQIMAYTTTIYFSEEEENQSSRVEGGGSFRTSRPGPCLSASALNSKEFTSAAADPLNRIEELKLKLTSCLLADSSGLLRLDYFLSKNETLFPKAFFRTTYFRSLSRTATMAAASAPTPALSSQEIIDNFWKATLGEPGVSAAKRKPQSNGKNGGH